MSHIEDLEKLRKEAALQERLAAIKAQKSMADFVRYTFPDYKWNWHNKLICAYLDAVVDGRIKRLMISLSPRHGKTELVSRRFPAFALGKNPNMNIIAASYGASLANKTNRDVQRIIDSDYYLDIFPNTKLFGKNSREATDGKWLRNAYQFEIVGYRGSYTSVGVGGGVTGKGCSLLLIDDTCKNSEEADSATVRESIYEWYRSTLRTRLEDNGAIVMTQTRWHEDDLPGRLIEDMSDGTADQWIILNLPAIKEEGGHPKDPRQIGEALWPEAFPLDVLLQTRSTVGTRVWNALYQGRPAPAEGGLFKRHWWKFYDTAPATFDEKIISADMTFKETKSGSFVVIQAWGRIASDYYLLDMLRERLDFVGTLEAFRSFAKKHPDARAKLVEDAANGPAVISALKSEIPGIIAISAKDSKVARANSVTPVIESGNVYLPAKTIAPWIDLVVEECAVFPNGVTDDIVDCMSQSLRRFIKADIKRISPISIVRASPLLG